MKYKSSRLKLEFSTFSMTSWCTFGSGILKSRYDSLYVSGMRWEFLGLLSFCSASFSFNALGFSLVACAFRAWHWTAHIFRRLWKLLYHSYIFLSFHVMNWPLLVDMDKVLSCFPLMKVALAPPMVRMFIGIGKSVFLHEASFIYHQIGQPIGYQLLAQRNECNEYSSFSLHNVFIPYS